MADATQVQIRRDTAAVLDTVTPALAELAYDQSFKRLRLGDGVTIGATTLPNAADTQLHSFSFAVAGGTGNAITLAVFPAPSSYAQPLSLRLKATASNTGATTINVNGLGVKNISKYSGGSLIALASGDIVSGGIYDIAYDGTQFQLMNNVPPALTLIGQADLKTANHTFSATCSNLISGANWYRSGRLVLSSGNYAFSLLSYDGSGVGGLVGNAWVPFNNAAAYTNAVMAIRTDNSSGTLANGSQLYVTASPPYDMGDGEVGGFIYVLLNESGDVVGHSASGTPSWAYNGPTSIRPDYICRLTGKKYKEQLVPQSIEEIMDGAPLKYERVEITNELKNADMALIPHPFDVPPGHKVVLLDPMSDKVRRIIEYQDAGGMDFVDALLKGHIKIDSDKIKRKCPKSVTPCKFSYKRT